MSDHYYTVGTHGPPTEETAPHGFFYVADGDWTERVRYATGERTLANEDSVWWPVPAPPTEPAPAPEPVARWAVMWCESLLANVLTVGGLRAGPEGLAAAAAALNALDRDGVAWGPGRPMSELPDGHHPRVLLRADGGPYVAANTYRSTDAEHKRLCWWPLPGATDGR